MYGGAGANGISLAEIYYGSVRTLGKTLAESSQPTARCKGMDEDKEMDEGMDEGMSNSHQNDLLRKSCVKYRPICWEVSVPIDRKDDSAGYIQTQQYNVKKVLDCEYFKDELFYKISWDDYSSTHNSWEPSSKMWIDIPDLLKEYHEHHPKPTRIDPEDDPDLDSTSFYSSDHEDVMSPFNADAEDEYKPSVDGSGSESSEYASDGMDEDSDGSHNSQAYSDSSSARSGMGG
jgi:hypothetical protein